MQGDNFSGYKYFNSGTRKHPDQSKEETHITQVVERELEPTQKSRPIICILWIYNTRLAARCCVKQHQKGCRFTPAQHLFCLHQREAEGRREREDRQKNGKRGGVFLGEGKRRDVGKKNKVLVRGGGAVGGWALLVVAEEKQEGDVGK